MTVARVQPTEEAGFIFPPCPALRWTQHHKSGYQTIFKILWEVAGKIRRRGRRSANPPHYIMAKKCEGTNTSQPNGNTAMGLCLLFKIQYCSYDDAVMLMVVVWWWWRCYLSSRWYMMMVMLVFSYLSTHRGTNKRASLFPVLAQALSLGVMGNCNLFLDATSVALLTWACIVGRCCYFRSICRLLFPAFSNPFFYMYTQMDIAGCTIIRWPNLYILSLISNQHMMFLLPYLWCHHILGCLFWSHWYLFSGIWFHKWSFSHELSFATRSDIGS